MQCIFPDAQALLWWLAGDQRLPRRSHQAVADPENRVLASAVSAWEVAIRSALGKLEAPGDLIEVVETSGLEWIPVEPPGAYAAEGLPMHHRDPFDRLLVAQALERSAQLISRDDKLDPYGVERIWQ